MLPSTTERVAQNTSHQLNQQIHLLTEENVARVAAAGPAAITRRLEELDHEWDIERTLEANAATAVLVGVTLGATVNRKWFFFPAVVAGFLLQHAVQGWCPPLPVFRRFGLRTQSEIEKERYALKALRGDFSQVREAVSGQEQARAGQAIQAIQALQAVKS
ncbi:MAG: hypothetical protein SH850_20050 [Planctomycetaceae bacterium]|nr:hypothetical protein [Planctomycetaceae bacterium]